MASVSHQGMTSLRTSPFPLRGTDRAEDIWPSRSVRWSRGARGRVRITCVWPIGITQVCRAYWGFWPMRLRFILPPQLYLDAFREPSPGDLHQFEPAERFFKSLDGKLVLRVVARPRHHEILAKL